MLVLESSPEGPCYLRDGLGEVAKDAAIQRTRTERTRTTKRSYKSQLRTHLFPVSYFKQL